MDNVIGPVRVRAQCLCNVIFIGKKGNIKDENGSSILYLNANINILINLGHL